MTILTKLNQVTRVVRLPILLHFLNPGANVMNVTYASIDLNIHI